MTISGQTPHGRSEHYGDAMPSAMHLYRCKARGQGQGHQKLLNQCMSIRAQPQAQYPNQTNLHQWS